MSLEKLLTNAHTPHAINLLNPSTSTILHNGMGIQHGSFGKIAETCSAYNFSNKYNSHTYPLFEKLNLLKLKDLFELVLKLYYKYKKNDLPFYIWKMFSYFNAGHPYNFRTEYILEDNGFIRPSGDNCIRHYLPSAINKSKPDTLDKISTHTIQGFALYIQRAIISNYRAECIIRNCYICNYCP